MNFSWKEALVFSALFAFLLAPACADKKNEEAIHFAVGGTPESLLFWEKLIGEFEVQTGLPVAQIRQPTDTNQRRQGLLIPLMAKQKNPDVYLLDVAWIAQFAASGWLEPLDPFLASTETSPNSFFRPILEKADTYQGEIIALPLFHDGGLLYYRKDLLENFGFQRPPETWNELIQMAAAIQKEKRKTSPHFYGFVWQGAQYEGLLCNFLEFAVSNQGGISLNPQEMKLDSEQNRAALELMADLIHKYKISPPNTFTEMKEETVRLYFQSGNALFERNWPYAWALHEAEGSPVRGKTGVAPLPHFEGGRSTTTLGGWHIGISKYSDVKTEAWKLVQFLVSYPIQKRLAVSLGWNPARKDVYEDPEVLGKLPYLTELRKVFDAAALRPLVPYYSQISEVIQKPINAVLARQLSAREGLQKAETQAQKIVRRYQTG